MGNNENLATSEPNIENMIYEFRGKQYYSKVSNWNLGKRT